MERTSEDDIKDLTLSPKESGNKKLKLNDGSSQDSFTESPSGSKDEKKENVDSGVSADKSEITCSDDGATTTAEAFLNEVVSVAPSTSNVKAMLLDIKKKPDMDLDSDWSQDSDDLSNGEEQLTGLLLHPMYQADTSDSISDISSARSTDSYGIFADMLTESTTGDTMTDSDSDEESWFWSNRNQMKREPPAVLSKTRPKHSYLMLREIINREHGVTFPAGKAVQTNVMFEQKFYGSLHAVYRLDNLHNLLKHRGCVNSTNFHPDGRLLASGSDDLTVIVWDWAKRTALETINTGHSTNVLQNKFLYLNAQSQINIATCSTDGQVRFLSVPPSGTATPEHADSRVLGEHARVVRSLHVWPAEPHLVLSAAEDGVVLCSDVRAERAVKMIHAKRSVLGSSIPLYSVAGHPLRNQEVLVAGRDRNVRVYDTRRATAPLAMYCPAHFKNKKVGKSPQIWLTMHVTNAEYNYDGSEILASYNNEDIYLFNTKNDVSDEDTSDEKDGYTYRYNGHRNDVTFKANYGATFFGPKSEYIVSGSNCSYLYIWEKKSEAIVQWMLGEHNGVVNCIETHPRFPVMATSGLGRDVKIWIPKGKADPTYYGMEGVLRDNKERNPLFHDYLPSFYSPYLGVNRRSADDVPD